MTPGVPVGLVCACLAATATSPIVRALAVAAPVAIDSLWRHRNHEWDLIEQRDRCHQHLRRHP